jgi:hypothetical protein
MIGWCTTMSGVVAAVAVGKTLMPVLGDAFKSKALASMIDRVSSKLEYHILFRHRITKRVRSACDFSFPCSPYRKWLKSLAQADYSKPIEQVSVQLALKLDEAFGAKSAEWRNLSDHLSRALRLVEQTFPALAAELPDKEYRQLTEQWAQQRSVSVREQLLKQSGPDAALSAADLSAVLLRSSDARRSVRLRAFNLEAADLNTYFQGIKIPDVPVGELRILTGDFGSGKSDMAEAWYRSSARTLASVHDSAVPVWLSAKDLGNRPLEQVINAQIGTKWRHGRGVDLVVDGLDETDPASAQAALDHARALVRSFDNVRVLMTARPGVIEPNFGEKLPVSLLSTEEAGDLVVLAGAAKGTTFGWSKALRASITRPFFALAAGRALSRDRAPHGEADLIRAVVEDALHQGSELASVGSDVIYTVLKRLAVLLTDGISGTNLSFKNRQTALSSRLVTPFGRNRLAFSLPIFQQWFAAQAMLEGDAPIEKVVGGATGFSHWRWAAAIAIIDLSEQDTERLDGFIAQWVTSNPGVASWILIRAFGKAGSWNGPNDAPLDPVTSGPRLLKALRTWSGALGAWAGCVLPQQVISGPMELGITVDGRQLIFGFSKRTVSHDTIVDWPKDLNPFHVDSTSKWQFWFSRTAPPNAAWPWLVIQDLIAKASEKSLKNEPYLGGSNGIWGEERRYAIALSLTGHHGSLMRPTISANDIRTTAIGLRDRIGPHGIVKVNSTQIFADELDDIVRRLDDSSTAELPSPVPVPDAVQSMKSGWVWDLFTEEGLKKFEVEVYARACVAYDEALANAFSAFAWSMPGTVLQPMGVILGLSYVDGFADRTPCLSVVRVPMDLITELAPTDPSTVWAKSGRAVIHREVDDRRNDFSQRGRDYFEHIRQWLARKNIEPANLPGWSETIEGSISKERPSVAIAVGWLDEDLKSLGLVDGIIHNVQ